MTHLKSKIPHTHFGDQTSHNVGPTYTLLTSKIPHTHIWDQRSHIHIFEIIDPIYTLRRSKIPHTHFGDQRPHIHTFRHQRPHILPHTHIWNQRPHILTSEIKDPSYTLRRSKIPHAATWYQRWGQSLVCSSWAWGRGGARRGWTRSLRWQVRSLNRPGDNIISHVHSDNPKFENLQET